MQETRIISSVGQLPVARVDQVLKYFEKCVCYLRNLLPSWHHTTGHKDTDLLTAFKHSYGALRVAHHASKQPALFS